MKIVNRKAKHDYHILETMEAGIQLTGPEVKSIKGGRISMSGSFVKIIGDEVFLVNADIPLYKYASVENYQSKRSRKLLLHKNELVKLITKINQYKLTVVPLACYTTRRRGVIKLEIALAKRKKEKDKRKELRERDSKREVERELRDKR